MMNRSNENFFNLENASDRKCHVRIWTSSHPTLIIGAKNPLDKTISWLRFVTPLYVEGPNIWKGANFYIASTDELMSYWELVWNNRIDKEKFANYKLFMAQIKDTQAYFKVIAPDARLATMEDVKSFNT